jgi:choline-sulfatase
MSGAEVLAPARKVLMISIDCLRADALFDRTGFLRQLDLPDDLDWPHLRWLSQTSTRFTQCVTTSPYTTASHASVFTGTFPRRHGVRDYFKTGLKAETIFEILRRKHVKTRFVTDYPLILGDDLGFRRGVADYRVEEQTEALVEFSGSDRSEIMFAHFADAHFPYGAHVIRNHEEFLTDFLGAEEKNLGLSRMDQDTPPASLEAIRSPDESRLEQRYRRVLTERYRNGDYRTMLRWYARGLSRFDQGRFASFVSVLRESGLLDREDVMVVLFGDHGEDWSDSCWAHFNSCDWSVLNVPLLIRRLGQAPQTHTDLVRTVDVMPTILRAMGLSETGLELDGRDLGSRNGDDATAFAECWLSDTAVLQEFIRAVHAGQRSAELPSHLAKDAAFRSCRQLQRSFGSAGGPPVSQSLTERGLQIVDPVAWRQLSEALDAYHATADESVLPESPVELAEALRHIGYFGGR